MLEGKTVVLNTAPTAWGGGCPNMEFSYFPLKIHRFYLEASKVMGVPLFHHPFIDGIFHELNHPAMGIPPFMDPPMVGFMGNHRNPWDFWSSPRSQNPKNLRRRVSFDEVLVMQHTCFRRYRTKFLRTGLESFGWRWVKGFNVFLGFSMFFSEGFKWVMDFDDA